MGLWNESKRIVVKVGSNTLTHTTGKLNLRRIEVLAQTLADLMNQGKEIILVSSGAVSAGIAKSGAAERPVTLEGKQAMAAIGQSELMKLYDRYFSDYNIKVAQLLLTKDVMTDPVRQKYAQSTFETLLNMGVLPIVNENDPVSDDELTRFGGNDILSAYVACLCNADLLLNLSDVDGLYTADPRKDPLAKLISRVDRIEDVQGAAGGAGSDRGTGGMEAKLTAAQMSVKAGIPMFILNGQDPRILHRLADGEHVGTYFSAARAKQ